MEDDMEKTARDRRWNDYVRGIPVIGKWLERKEQVAVLRMAGVIADSSMMRRAGINFHKFRDAVRDAFDLPRVKCVALLINSPGGAPAQCSLISSLIRDLASEKDVPVVAFVEDVAASGGYWLACAGDEIHVQETSIVGSIGVISSGFGLDQMIERHGVTRRVHTSGRDKSFLDPFKPEKADDVARLKSIQGKMHESFKDWVRERRAGKLKGDEKDLMEGAFWTGRDAVEFGLADSVGDIITVMKRKYGDDVQFVDCSPEKKSFIASLLPFAGEAKIFDPGALIDAAEEKTFWNRYGL